RISVSARSATVFFWRNTDANCFALPSAKARKLQNGFGNCIGRNCPQKLTDGTQRKSERSPAVHSNELTEGQKPNSGRRINYAQIQVRVRQRLQTWENVVARLLR